QFNHAIRSQIKTTGPYNPEAFSHLYQSFEATLGTPGQSIYDKMLTGIAEVLQIPELGKYTAITRTLKKYGTLEALVNAMPESVQQTKHQIEQVIKATTQHLEEARKEFFREWQNYRLH